MILSRWRREVIWPSGLVDNISEIATGTVGRKTELHRSKSKRSFLAPIKSLVLALLLVTMPAVWAETSSSGAPNVGEAHQQSIDRAWKQAVEGKNPSSSCAGIKGRAMGSTDAAAFRALYACNVDIPARYYETYLDQVEAGEKTCQDFMVEMMTQLPAMTMSTDAMQGVIDSMAASGDNEAAVTEALGEAAEEAMTEEGLEDPKRIIKNRLDGRTRELCPGFADVILR